MNVVGPPVAVAPLVSLVAQVRVNHGSVTFTASLNVTLRLASFGSVAPFAGTVAVTDGAVSTTGTSNVGVIEKSSTASPSSELVALKSVQRIQNEAPLGMLNPESVLAMAVRLAAALPSSAPAVPAATGLEKSRLS